MALNKYKVVDQENAGKVHTFVMGQTKYINDGLTDEEAEVLFNNGNPFIAINENYHEEPTPPSVYKNLLSPSIK
ncbi:hypothetical protein VB264_16725 [Arcicella aquatica]|uniref:Uncharacterized protein n=1 Tax=Arcicella aquatica TaxID=217141 RepID=A0ABU5QST2_9BACT|nr:hypothetical protein [Arcicella aquatica]MEA5259446.1 hypothetical protein [Arcicella aquatica]